MRKSTGMAFLALFAAITVFAAPQSAGAQECISLCNTCGWPLKIVTNGQPHNSTSYPSPDCYITLCEGMTCINPNDQEDLDLALKAAAAGLTHEVLAVADRGDRFVINRQRNSLQLMSNCRPGEVVVNIPLGEAQLVTPARLSETVTFALRTPTQPSGM